MGITTQAAGSPAKPAAGGAANRAGIQILDRPGTRFERSIAVARYATAYRKADKAGVAPKRNLMKVAGTSTAKLRRETRKLDNSVASGVPGGSTAASPESYGVSQATLDSIAACESGGNPAAVSPDGTYRGKYQFDYGTWAAMGGSGDPAAAPEAEQDMRAAMLYSSSGSSPWPICG
jgi:soluble lytic murein transglycosylase-like protein